MGTILTAYFTTERPTSDPHGFKMLSLKSNLYSPLSNSPSNSYDLEERSVPRSSDRKITTLYSGCSTNCSRKSKQRNPLLLVTFPPKSSSLVKDTSHLRKSTRNYSIPNSSSLKSMVPVKMDPPNTRRPTLSLLSKESKSRPRTFSLLLLSTSSLPRRNASNVRVTMMEI